MSQEFELSILDDLGFSKGKELELKSQLRKLNRRLENLPSKREDLKPKLEDILSRINSYSLMPSIDEKADKLADILISAKEKEAMEDPEHSRIIALRNSLDEPYFLGNVRGGGIFT